MVANARVVGTSTQFHVTLSEGRTLNATLVGTPPPPPGGTPPPPTDELAVVKLSGSGLPSRPRGPTRARWRPATSSSRAGPRLAQELTVENLSPGMCREGPATIATRELSTVSRVSP